MVIDIVERTPSALWQDQQRLALIDSDGVVLDRVPVDKMPDLPLVIGPAPMPARASSSAILADAPTLQAQLASATWVGGRRWDLSFQSGEIVQLPEGEKPARTALANFANNDRVRPARPRNPSLRLAQGGADDRPPAARAGRADPSRTVTTTVEG